MGIQLYPPWILTACKWTWRVGRRGFLFGGVPASWQVRTGSFRKGILFFGGVVKKAFFSWNRNDGFCGHDDDDDDDDDDGDGDGDDDDYDAADDDDDDDDDDADAADHDDDESKNTVQNLGRRYRKPPPHAAHGQRKRCLYICSSSWWGRMVFLRGFKSIKLFPVFPFASLNIQVGEVAGCSTTSKKGEVQHCITAIITRFVW